MFTPESLMMDRLGINPMRSIHDRGFNFLTRNKLLRLSDPRPEGAVKWADLSFKTSEVEAGESAHRIKEDPPSLESGPWMKEAKIDGVYEHLEVYGSTDAALRMSYRREIIWRRWTESYRDNGLILPKGLRDRDIHIFRIDGLPTSLDVSERIQTASIKIILSPQEHHTLVYAAQLDVGDLFEMDITWLVGVMGEDL